MARPSLTSTLDEVLHSFPTETLMTFEFFLLLGESLLSEQRGRAIARHVCRGKHKLKQHKLKNGAFMHDTSSTIAKQAGRRELPSKHSRHKDQRDGPRREIKQFPRAERGGKALATDRQLQHWFSRQGFYRMIVVELGRSNLRLMAGHALMPVSVVSSLENMNMNSTSANGFPLTRRVFAV